MVVSATNKDALGLSLVFLKQLAKFRQLGDPIVSGELKHGEEIKYVLQDEHWVKPPLRPGTR
jgi:hypothetical protein